MTIGAFRQLTRHSLTPSIFNRKNTDPTALDHSYSGPFSTVAVGQRVGEPKIHFGFNAVDDLTKNLMPEEHWCVKNANIHKRNTFSSGRTSARSAMKKVGLPPHPLLRNQDGSVRWPRGVAGSLTHTDDWAIAAVAIKSMSGTEYLGIDLEKIKSLESSTLQLIATEKERKELAIDKNNPWLAVALFSMKESVYKCLRPLYGQFIEFQDIEINDLASGKPSVTFISESLSGACKEEHIELRLVVEDRHVLTIAWLK